jgi:hypothetical protein
MGIPVVLVYSGFLSAAGVINLGEPFIDWADWPLIRIWKQEFSAPIQSRAGLRFPYCCLSLRSSRLAEKPPSPRFLISRPLEIVEKWFVQKCALYSSRRNDSGSSRTLPFSAFVGGFGYSLAIISEQASTCTMAANSETFAEHMMSVVAVPLFISNILLVNYNAT